MFLSHVVKTKKNTVRHITRLYIKPLSCRSLATTDYACIRGSGARVHSLGGVFRSSRIGYVRYSDSFRIHCASLLSGMGMPPDAPGGIFLFVFQRIYEADTGVGGSLTSCLGRQNTL